MTTPRPGYCQPADLLAGDIPLPTWITREQVIAAAADEIDSYLGYVYETPIPTTAATGAEPISKVVGLTLKRINAALASGRLILQIASSDEQAQLHAYGSSLVQEALVALKSIAAGEIIFENVPTAEGTPTETPSMPLISNLDSESAVEAFYDRIASPTYQFYPPSRPIGDGYRL